MFAIPQLSPTGWKAWKLDKDERSRDTSYIAIPRVKRSNKGSFTIMFFSCSWPGICPQKKKKKKAGVQFKIPASSVCIGIRTGGDIVLYDLKDSAHVSLMLCKAKDSNLLVTTKEIKGIHWKISFSNLIHILFDCV